MSKRTFTRSNAYAGNTHTNNIDESMQQFFLLKSEPNDFSITNLQQNQTEEWNGIRNYQARNTLRTMKEGDRAFFYHSKTSTPALTGIVGICRIARIVQPDLSALDPSSEYYDVNCTKENCKWDSVLVEYETTFPLVLSLKEIKAKAREDPSGIIAGLSLLKQRRLSVVSLSIKEWDAIIQLIDTKIGDMTTENLAMNKDITVDK